MCHALLRVTWLVSAFHDVRSSASSALSSRAGAMRLTACGLLWCSLRSAIGAANLQDHSESWAAAGLVDQLVQARADAMRGVRVRVAG